MNAWSLVERGFRLYPDREAVVYGNQRITYRELLKRIERVASVLHQLGLHKGDRVCLLSGNNPTIIEAQYAIIKIGLIWTPLSSRQHPNEHLWVIQNSGAKVVMFHEDFLDGIQSIRDQATGVEHFICFGSSSEQGILNLAKLAEDTATVAPEVDISGDEIIAILHTSGTTGKPKGVMLSHTNWVMTALVTMATLQVVSDDRALYVAPLNHGSGLLLSPHFYHGATNVILPTLDFDLFFETIEKEKITTIWLAPTIIYMLLAHPAIRNYRFDSLRTLVYTSSPMAVEKLKEAIKIFGPVFSQAYGLTECPVMTGLEKEDHSLDTMPEKLKRLGSAGMPNFMSEVRIVNDKGEILHTGKIGEIVVRSPLVMKGYWKEPEATAEALKDGWLHTGDMGRFDEDGFLYIEDRKKDMIISGGFNIYPKEIEDVIFGHPSVLEAAVIGVPHEKWGETPKVLVVPKPGETIAENEIIELCKANLASYKKPTSVEIVDDLPKNPNGKVLKGQLREKYWQGMDRKVH